MKLTTSSPAKLLVVYGLATSVIPFISFVEGAYENWTHTLLIPTPVIVMFDSVCKWIVVGIGVPFLFAIIQPIVFAMRREWSKARDSFLYSLGAVICIAAFAPIVFLLMMFLEMRI